MIRQNALVAMVACVVVLAIWLRVHSHAPSTIERDFPIPSFGQPVFSTPAPRDYVLQPIVVPDEADAGPRRIISLAPSVTEIVFALGMRDRLVGCTRYCQYLPGLEHVQVVGVMAESNYGMIKTFEPDLVLATRNSGDTVSNLTRLGLPVETVAHEGLPEVYAAIARIGQLCGRPRTAETLTAAIAADLERLKASAKRLQIPAKHVIVLFGELPVPPKAVFVAGPGLFLDSLVEDAGHLNAAREVLKSSQGEIPLEVLRELDPDIILECREQADEQTMTDVYRSWSRVGNLRAIRDRQVRQIGGPEWLSAGPRVAIELHRFISVLSETR